MKKILNTICCGVMLGATANGAVLAGYDFDDGTGTATTNATFVDTNVTATAFGVGAGLNSVINGPNANSNTSNLDAEGNVFGTDFGLEFGGARGDLGFTDQNNQNNLASAINQNDFLTFSLTADAGQVLDLTSFSFVSRVNNLNNSAERWALFSDVGGFAAVGDEIAAGQSASVEVYEDFVVDLSAPEFQDLTDIEFRLYIFGGNAPNNSATLFDKVIVNGDVTAVPEPSSMALIGLGSLAFLLRRKK